MFIIKNNPNSSKLINSTLAIKLKFYIINVTNQKKSYYQLLEVQQTATTQQIRKQFLLKARKYHPDHNDSPTAHQQFKKVKQAYQTLKDSQKRFLYDSGLSTQTKQQQDIYYSRRSGAAGRKYYQNKWYGFKKSTYHDLRDDFYTSRQSKPLNYGILQRTATIIIILTGLFGWDYFMSRKTKGSIQYQHHKNILQSSIPEDEKQRKRIQKYIQKRSKQHIV